MTIYKRGDVILVRFPNSNFKTYKKRPALIVQANELRTELRQLIVVTITSNLNRTGVTRIKVDKNSLVGRKMRLMMNSVIVVDNLATVLEREIDKIIGNCPIDDCLYLYEEWKTKSDLENHYKQNYTEAVFERYQEWLAKPVEVIKMRPLD